MKENTNNLVQRAQQGDIRAFEKLVEFFQDAVFGAAYAIAQNFHHAEEIAQEAFGGYSCNKASRMSTFSRAFRAAAMFGPATWGVGL